MSSLVYYTEHVTICIPHYIAVRRNCNSITPQIYTKDRKRRSKFSLLIWMRLKSTMAVDVGLVCVGLRLKSWSVCVLASDKETEQKYGHLQHTKLDKDPRPHVKMDTHVETMKITRINLITKLQISGKINADMKLYLLY